MVTEELVIGGVSRLQRVVGEMAESRTVAVTPLNGSNYVTWRVQCKMALMKEGLWNIVCGTEVAPGERDAGYSKFVGRRDKALAIVVLSVDPTLLYLIGEPTDPKAVWVKLANQFQKKTWANKLEMRRKLHSMRMKEDDSIQAHIRQMTEVFNELSAMDAAMSEEDRVICLLASLPESFGVLITALEASDEIPKMDVVTERLLHEERKRKGREDVEEKAMVMMPRKPKKKGACFRCGKYGHYKWQCPELTGDQKEWKRGNHKANNAADDSSDSDALIVGHEALVAGMTSGWIVDSGATCHMCNSRSMFVEYRGLEKFEKVTLGDGHSLDAVGRGTVGLVVKLPGEKTKRLKLLNTLFVPGLSYNLLSVSKASEAGMATEFSESGCQIVNGDGKVRASATRHGSLYFLECEHTEQANAAAVPKEDVWHRRYGHLGAQGLRQLAVEGMVDGFNYDGSKEVSFCEPCTEGKHHRSPFPTDGGKRADEPLELVHSDVCGKINAKSFGGAEYFLTFIDDKTRYTWVYLLKNKSEVFNRFLKWKAMVENAVGKKLKVLRSDNGGEYTGKQFQEYLKSEGVRHELTVPKTPQQNGVAERLNRTLVEMVRTMLVESKLNQRFWGEAMSTAAYLRNRCPTKAVEGMTPFEALYGTKPNVKHLRAFGCVCYPLIMKDERKKLDPVARRCVLVGYGTEVKGYRLYDPNRVGKMIYSRDVKFNESEFGIEKESSLEEPIHYIELEVSSSVDNEEPAVEASEEVIPEQPAIRKSDRHRQRPDYYGERVSVAKDGLEEPATVIEALSSQKKAKWEEAMKAEMRSLQDNDVWELVELPKDRKPVGSKWVFKVKTNENGDVERYKARLVAQGFMQVKGADYDETFCPVVRMESLRALVAMSVRRSFKLHQLDITTAFLNGNLEEEVFMTQPEGFVIQGKQDMVCRLKRSLYMV